MMADKILLLLNKIERAFEHNLFTRRTLRELKILRLMTHENVIDLITIQKPLSEEKLDIYGVFEIMETDLGSIINSQQELTEQHMQFFTYQILRGMKYIHSAGILHRDLKPKNLLVNGNGDLKIGDFGLSRTNIPQMVKSGAMTDYIATRWYRAPELLGGAETYTEAVDTWSIGGILAELMLRQPLLPGDDTKNQLELIVACLGQPDKQFLQSFNEGRMQNIFGRLKNQNKAGKIDEIFAACNPDAIDLLKKMLVYDPLKRITVEDALNHDFIGDLHYAPDEPTTIPVTAFDFDFEMYDLNIEEQKELISEEIMLYHSKKAQKKYIKGRKKHPSGMLYLKYGYYEGFVMPEVVEKKKKSKKSKHKEKDEEELQQNNEEEKK